MKFKFVIYILLLTINVVSCQNSQTKKTTTSMLMSRIPRSEYNNNMTYYTDKAVSGNTLIEMLTNTTDEMKRFIESIPADKIDYAYGSGKWTLGEVLQHIISYEEIMLEVAMLNAGVITEKKHTIYYNQNTTVAGARSKSKSDLLKEFIEVRKATENAFNNLTEMQRKQMGTLDGNKTSVRVIAFCISGHQMHHFNVIANRYLN